MSNQREQLLERVTRAINTLQDIQADSRTPLADALALVEPIRQLTDYRRALRTEAFVIASTDPDYAAAVAHLKAITDTLATDLVALQEHAALVKLAAQAAGAVFKVAKAVGAIVL